MKRIFVILVSVWVLAGCTKKKTEELTPQPAPVETVSYDIPLIRGRNLDSLKHRAYSDRLLAFSIELGNRSKDFDQRLGGILAIKASGEPWQSAIKKSLTSDNYIAAQNYNILYLDSLRRILGEPLAKLRPSHQSLTLALIRLKNNYDILRDFQKFGGMAAILDSVLANEFAINQALREFKDRIEPAQ